MNRTAIVYDPFNLRHTLEGHPENFRRLKGTMELLAEEGMLDKLVTVSSSPAPVEAILAVHTPQYLERLQRLARSGGGHLDSDTYVNADSYEAALRSAGGLLNLVDAVLWRQAENGFALVRPPGHHALTYQGMGFCLFANAAIAARWAQRHHGIERVLVVDFDVHHGNGTQDIFYNDPSVLFFSTHQFPYYPGTGAATELGADKAYGSTVNVPFPPHVGDKGYLDAFQRILAPVALLFRPQCILLAAGLVAALSGLWMAMFYAIVPADNALLHAFRLFFGAAMALSIVLGYLAIRQRKVSEHQAWMRRAYATGIGAGTQALIQIPYIMLAGKPDPSALALLMGGAWILNLAVAEWLIRRPRVRSS